MITIVDYGMGNLSSVLNAIKKYTDDARISSRPGDIRSADKLILPGVGAFKDAYDELERRSLTEPILKFISSGKLFLGICLGMQLLFTKSYEDGEHKGFDIIRGEVVAFEKSKGLKIPHMGWNSLVNSTQLTVDGKCPLLERVPEGAYMYFVHSYYPVPQDEDVIVATTEYGIEFCSFLQKGNIYAMQFHPEKSQKDGLKIIENFVRL
jgi:glutamine amidotransferase